MSEFMDDIEKSYNRRNMDDFSATYDALTKVWTRLRQCRYERSKPDQPLDFEISTGDPFVRHTWIPGANGVPEVQGVRFRQKIARKMPYRWGRGNVDTMPIAYNRAVAGFYPENRPDPRDKQGEIFSHESILFVDLIDNTVQSIDFDDGCLTVYNKKDRTEYTTVNMYEILFKQHKQNWENLNLRFVGTCRQEWNNLQTEIEFSRKEGHPTERGARIRPALPWTLGFAWP